MKESFSKLSTNLIFCFIAASTLIASLFLLPTTSEFFEFNKFTAILIITITSIILWSVKMVSEKRFTFTKTPLDVPIITLIVVYLAATLASMDQYRSFIGGDGKIWPTFLPLATIGLFYFVITSNLKYKKQVEVILWTLITGTTIAAVISTLSFFGVFLPFDFAQIRAFNTLGIVTRLALLESFILPITVSTALFAKNKSAQFAAAAITILIFFSFVLINFLPAYLPLAAGLGLITIGTMKTKLSKSSQGIAAAIATFAVLFLVMRFVPQVTSGTLKAWINSPADQNGVNIINTVRLKSAPSWDIATSTIGKRPLLGTGPGTFAFAYTQLKPRYLNATDTWSVRFDEPASMFTEIITTTGIFGTLAYLLLIVAIVRFIWTLIFKSTNPQQYLAPAAAILSILVAIFVASLSFSLIVPFFILLALLSTMAKATDENYVYDVTVELATLRGRFSWFPIGTPNDLIKTSPETAKGPRSQILPTLFLVAVLALSALAIRFQLKAYQGEYFYRQSLLAARSNDGNRTVNFLQRAIGANPNVDTYHRIMAQTVLAAAIELSNRQGIDEKAKQDLLVQLAQVGIDQSKVASGYQILPLRLPGISAANVANWETAGAVYQALIGAVQGSDVHAINTLSQAVQLDPENPILHDRLGLLYLRVGNKDLAQRKFEDAVIIKGDFGPASYHLAKLLIDQNGDVGRIVSSLNAAKQFLPKDDPAIADIDKNLTTYTQKLQDLQKQQQEQVNQQQSTQNASPKPSTSPSPSPTPSPSTSPQPSPSPIQSPSL